MGNVGEWTRADREKLFAESIEHWTPEAQEDMLVEECGELIVAMNKLRRKPSLETLNHLAEEIADVLFMIEEIVFYHDKYGESSTDIFMEDPVSFGAMIENWFESKLNRTQSRLAASKAREEVIVGVWTESPNI